MATEILKLTAQIIISHASMSELSTNELVDEIKDVYQVLASLEGGAAISGTMAPPKGAETEVLMKPSIPLKDIVQEKHVVCLECGRRMKTLKAHIRKSHSLLPKEYFKKFGLDPKKFPLVCKEYSEQRSKMAKDRGLGQGGRKPKGTA